MARSSVGLVLLLLLCSCSPAPVLEEEKSRQRLDASVPGAEEWTARGRAITSQAFSLLSSNLLQAIEQGGAQNSLPYCSAMAMPLTRIVADTNSVSLRRVSHRVRNPGNRANTEELALIAEYRTTRAAGGVLSPVLMADGHVTYYAPIVITNALCLQCHGTPEKEVTLEVLSSIRKHYPADEAVGFEMGEVRGLWRVDFQQ